MAAQVVEISSNNTRALKKKLIELPAVISAAQLGARLRVLVDKSEPFPIEYLQRQTFVDANISLEQVRPSLEDVFVTCTGKEKS
jgi:ABC-2 type transport system ATP-binding protein